MSRTHLVTGVAGQDGLLLARLLRARGDRVVGTILPGAKIGALGCYLDTIEMVEHDVRDTDGFMRLVHTHRPAVVHNLAGLSSVAASWDDPDLTHEVNEVAVVDMLVVLSRLAADAPAFVQASSAEVFGRVAFGRADESTPIQPRSPYGEAKAAAGRAVAASRRAGLHATNLVLFGHTSALHAPHFVLPRIVSSALDVADGVATRIELHDPTTTRDWGSAHDVVEAFAAAASSTAGDYVIGTGLLHSVTEVAQWAMADAGVEADVVRVGEPRPNDHDGVRADASLAGRELGWTPRRGLRATIRRMVEVEQQRRATGVEHDPAYAAP